MSLWETRGDSSHGLDELYPLIAQLRVLNLPDYCAVNELRGLPRPFYLLNDGAEFELVDHSFREELHPDEGLYTFDLECDLNADIPPDWDHTARGPASVAGLAKCLAARMRTFVNSRGRLKSAAGLGCLSALAATFWTVAHQPIAQTGHAEPRLRGEVFEACLAALNLGEHVEVAERILVRNHRHHLRCCVEALPPGWTSPAWNGALGLFEWEANSLIIGWPTRP